MQTSTPPQKAHLARPKITRDSSFLLSAMYAISLDSNSNMMIAQRAVVNVIIRAFYECLA